MDYELWSARGATGWHWANVLPYFKKLEQKDSNLQDELISPLGKQPSASANSATPQCFLRNRYLDAVLVVPLKKRDFKASPATYVEKVGNLLFRVFRLVPRRGILPLPWFS